MNCPDLDYLKRGDDLITYLYTSVPLPLTAGHRGRRRWGRQAGSGGKGGIQGRAVDTEASRYNIKNKEIDWVRAVRERRRGRGLPCRRRRRRGRETPAPPRERTRTLRFVEENGDFAEMPF
jgi:hypothetical protein